MGGTCNIHRDGKKTFKRSPEKPDISGRIVSKLILREMGFQRVDWIQEGASMNTETNLVP
jgi:hypothetical protein